MKKIVLVILSLVTIFLIIKKVKFEKNNKKIIVNSKRTKRFKNKKKFLERDVN